MQEIIAHTDEIAAPALQERRDSEAVGNSLRVFQDESETRVVVNGVEITDIVSYSVSFDRRHDSRPVPRLRLETEIRGAVNLEL